MAMPPPPPPSGPTAGGSKPDRKTVERNRRNQMNGLYHRLDTLVHAGGAPSAAPGATRPERLGEAAAYISRTTERVERLKERKRELTAAARMTQQNPGPGGSGSGSGAAAALPEVTVQHLGSGLHAILVTGAPPSDGASFHRSVRAVEEAGGEVQNAHFSVVGARAVYTIHVLVGEQQGSIERVVQRLKETVRGHAR
uniref:Uncharacterized protein n=1 Tax=Avena sativa TaxID=4498 RepID=A0ACD5Z4X9_AVESA